jgi:hypothetical protein
MLDSNASHAVLENPLSTSFSHGLLDFLEYYYFMACRRAIKS